MLDIELEKHPKKRSKASLKSTRRINDFKSECYKVPKKIIVNADKIEYKKVSMKVQFTLSHISV